MTYPLMDTLYSAIFRMSLHELTNVELKRHGCLADLLSRGQVLRRLHCQDHSHLPPLARVTVRVLDADCEDPFHAIRQLRRLREELEGEGSDFHRITTSSVAGYRQTMTSGVGLDMQPDPDSKSIFGVEEFAGEDGDMTDEDEEDEDSVDRDVKGKTKGNGNKGNKLLFWSGEITSANISLLSLRTAVVEQQQQQKKKQQQSARDASDSGSVHKSVSWSDLQNELGPISNQNQAETLQQRISRSFELETTETTSSPSSRGELPLPGRSRADANGRRSPRKRLRQSTSVPSPLAYLSAHPDNKPQRRTKKTAAQRLFEASSPGSSSIESDTSSVKRHLKTARLSAVGDGFRWKSVESLMAGNVSGEQVQRQILSIQRMVTNGDVAALSQLSKTHSDVDFSLPLRGVTPLALSVYLGAPDVTRELLLIMDRLGQLSRALNMTSTDASSKTSSSNSSDHQHRETALVAACRTGQLQCAMLLLHYADNGDPRKPAASGRFTPLDTEVRDGQGRTALWHAVDGGHTALVAALVEEGGAKVYYPNGDLSCPLQLACKNLRRMGRKGKLIVRYLASHGANLDYVDHALRNALYWTVCISGCAETTKFLLEAGCCVQPWSWLQQENLSPALLSTSTPGSRLRLRAAARAPAPLKSLARAACRRRMQRHSAGRSVFPLLDRLVDRGVVGAEQRRLIRLSDLRSASSSKSGKSSTD